MSQSWFRTGIGLVMVVVLLFVAGCSEEETSMSEARQERLPEQAIDPQTRKLLVESMPVHRVELSSEALSVWRMYSALQPTLLVLSNDPMLVPVPTGLLPSVLEMIAHGSQEEVARSAAPGLPDMLLQSSMTVDAALRSGWFSQFAWVFPRRDADQALSGDRLREQLLEGGLATEDEAAKLVVTEHMANGVLRETSMVAAALSHLPELGGPLIVHIDLSWFKQMYKNEIATPLLPLIIKTLTELRERQIPTLAVTFAYGNLDSRIALDVRFVGEVIARFIEQPETFDQSMPVNWQRKANILYLTNFFKKDETRELALAMDADEPDAAWIKFTLYRSAVEHNMGKVALSFLAEAVQLDKVYAMEYLVLADLAYEKGRPDESVRMLSLASAQFPENFNIKLKMAQLAAYMGNKETALHLVEQLQQLEWSAEYHPGMAQYLGGFASYLRGEEASGPQDHSKDPRRQRILK